MPLTATLHGARIDSVLITDEQWKTFKAASRASELLMACGKPGFPRTSRHGLRHFAHKSKADCVRPECWSETAQHLAAKAAVARAADADGWNATVEYPAPDRSWIADVMAEKNGRRVAFEIQWSRQSAEEFTRRQERYGSDDIECLWIIHRRNLAAAQEAEVPYAVFSDQITDLDVIPCEGLFAGDEAAPLADVVQHRLAGIQHGRIEVEVVEASFAMTEMGCFSCKAPSTVWVLDHVKARTRCGQTLYFSSTYELWAEKRIETTLRAAALEAVSTSGREWPPLSPLRMHHSNTAKAGYLAYGCTHCTRGFMGDYFIAHESDREPATAAVGVPMAVDSALLELPHTCVDRGDGHCSQDLDAREELPLKGRRSIAHPRQTAGEDAVTRLNWKETPRGPKKAPAARVSVAAVRASQTPKVSVARPAVPVSVPVAEPAAEQPAAVSISSTCDLCGIAEHAEYECLWRRLRRHSFFSPVSDGADWSEGHHYSDSIRARIIGGSLGVEEGIQWIRRSLIRDGIPAMDSSLRSGTGATA